ncbi:class I SAM-dependent methyltransferase [Nocardioides rubriscoriae]|uniref:class I SAM-dependent methyltransferase n=1 Tax=Nocardioides rubriscoriae TaxID=642762 RepID=UPI0011E04296|nr:methyltransferase domain-containing protein [Nocardioides rubriscoriae]
MGADEGRSGDAAGFVGAVADVYERLLVPMIFAEPAERLAGLVAERAPHDVLETAAGTGALTRALVRRCPDALITATDLNRPMLAAAAHAPGLAAEERVTWAPADALDLPYADASFDVVACQFGVMFFPDRVRGYAEARRVLRPGGAFVLDTWDRIETNELAWVIESAINATVPDDPLLFMGRTPHGYHDPDVVRADLAAAGYVDVTVTPVDGTSVTTPADAAVAYCQGTPLRVALDAHATLDADRATQVAERALRERYGDGPISAPTRWFEVVATTPDGPVTSR